MAKQSTSMRFSGMTARQLAKLIAKTGLTQSEVISHAIDRMYREEIKNMTTNTVTLKFVAQSGTTWEETVDADDVDSTVEQTVATHGDIDHVERLADPNDMSGETIWRFE